MEINRQFEDILARRIQEPLSTLQVVMGPRQVGKTTGVRHVFDVWPHSKVMASADLPAPPSSEWILHQWNSANAQKGDVLLVLDEVQKIPRWSDVIKMLFDRDRSKRKLRVVLLGSASLPLSTGLSDTLAGRYEIIPVPHWSYAESAAAFGWDFNTYFRYGGYPVAADFVNDPVRWQNFLRDAIIEPMLSRDIFGQSSIKKPALFRQIFEMAMHHPAQILSYHKFLGQLDEAGNISTIQHYLEILESAFLLKRLYAYSKNIIRQKSSSPKLIPSCPALVHAFVNPLKADQDSIWQGRLLELLVGIVLIQNYRSVEYWRKQDAEVDYVLTIDERVFAIEVKSSRLRSRKGINLFLKEYPDAIPLIIDQENILAFLNNPASFFPK